MKTELAARGTLSKHKILIVDDHPLLREGLARTIQHEKDLDVVGQAANAAEALKLVDELKPDLALVDLSMEGMNGIDLIKKIRSKPSKIRLLVLSTYNESLYAEKALLAGANGYIMKRENGQTLLAAIRIVIQGKTYLSEELNQAFIRKLTSPQSHVEEDPAVLLSARELETFRFIGQGYGTKQIAEKLHISMKTVEAHRGHIRNKFGLASNYQLVQKAIKWAHQETHFS